MAARHASGMRKTADMMTPELAPATCPVCGKGIPEGMGIRRTYRDKAYLMKCEHCADSFVAEPNRYLIGGPSHCDERWHGHD